MLFHGMTALDNLARTWREAHGETRWRDLVERSADLRGIEQSGEYLQLAAATLALEQIGKSNQALGLAGADVAHTADLLLEAVETVLRLYRGPAALGRRVQADIEPKAGRRPAGLGRSRAQLLAAYDALEALVVMLHVFEQSYLAQAQPLRTFNEGRRKDRRTRLAFERFIDHVAGRARTDYEAAAREAV